MRTLGILGGLVISAIVSCSDDSPTGGGSNQPSVSIACGSETCDKVCCPGAGCADTETACLNPDNGHGYYMKCDGPEDCAEGTVCCIGQGACACGSAQCVSPADCTQEFQKTACHDSTHCADGLECAPFDVADTFEPTLLACQPPS